MPSFQGERLLIDAKVDWESTRDLCRREGLTNRVQAFIFTGFSEGEEETELKAKQSLHLYPQRALFQRMLRSQFQGLSSGYTHAGRNWAHRRIIVFLMELLSVSWDEAYTHLRSTFLDLVITTQLEKRWFPLRSIWVVCQRWKGSCPRRSQGLSLIPCPFPLEVCSRGRIGQTPRSRVYN